MSEPVSRRSSRGDKDIRLSYKFQRLRETIRQAIQSGELTGKLPGERALAIRFKANAKTLGKALTELASEGLLDRKIGGGTYVRGMRPGRSAPKWLILSESEVHSPLIDAIKSIQPNCSTISPSASHRPGFLAQFDAAIDVGTATPSEFIRDLVVRGLPVISVVSEPRVYSTHAVLMDITLGAWQLSRELLIAGHRHLCAIETGQNNRVLHTMKMSAARYGPEATVTSGTIDRIEKIVRGGVTAIVCDSAELSKEALSVLRNASLAVPRDLSLVAVGCINGQAPCSGYFIHHSEHAATIAEVVAKGLPHRPSIIWLSGRHIDAGTFAAISNHAK